MTAIPPSRPNPSFHQLPLKNVENSPVSQDSPAPQDNPVAKKGKELIDKPAISAKDLQESKIDQLTSLKKESLQEITANFEEEFAKIATSLGLDNTVEKRDVNQVIGALIGLFQTGEAINSVSAGLLPNLNLISNYINLTVKNTQQIAEHGEVSGLLSQASKLLGMINDLSLTIQNKQVLEEKREVLKNKQEQLANLDQNDVNAEKKLLKEIKVLERDIKTSKFDINKNIKELGVKAALFLPGAADKVYSSVKFFGNFANNIPITSSIGIAGSLASVIDAGYELYKADVAMYSHERHALDLTSVKLAFDLTPVDKPITDLTPIEKPIPLKEQNELKLKQKEEATKWLDDLISQYKDDFTGFKQEVEKVGFFLDPSIVSFNEVTEDVRDILIQNYHLTPNQRAIKNLIDKRQNEFNARLEVETKWYNALTSEYKDDFDGFKLELEKSGLKLNDSIKSFRDISLETKNTLLKNHAELGVTLLANAKNQLKVRLEKNSELNQEFFNFKSLKSRIMYGVTSFSAVIATSLLAGMIAGAAFPPALLIIPGVLTTVAIVGLMALGIRHLYINKPNLAKTYLNFVPVKLLVINEAILPILKFCLTVVEWQEKGEETALLEKIDGIASDYFKILDDKEKDLLKPIDQQKMADITAEEIELAKEGLIKNIEDQLEVLHQDQSSNYWKNLISEYQKNVETLEAEVLQARKDDFAEYSGFGDIKKFKEELEDARALEDTLQRQFELSDNETKALKALPQRIVNLENKIASLQGRALDEFDIIAESLIKGEFWKDPESRAFIEKYAGIEFADDTQLDRAQLEENTKFLSSKLKHIILKDSKELLKWVEKQNMNEVEI